MYVYLCYHYEKRHQVDTGTLAFFRSICYLENDGGNKTRRVGKNGMRFRKEILIDLAHVDRSSLYVYSIRMPTHLTEHAQKSERDTLLKHRFYISE